MTHQRYSRNQNGSATGIENVSPSRLAGTPSALTFSEQHKNLDAPARSHLGEISVGALQNVQNLPQDATPIRRHIKAAAAAIHSLDTATPDSLAEDLSNFHIHSPPGQEHSDCIKPKGAAVQQSTICSPSTSLRAQKSVTKTKRTHFALPEKTGSGAEESGSSPRGTSMIYGFSC